MATRKKESSLGKEKRATCPSKSNVSITHGLRIPSPGSTVSNYLNKSTKSSSSDAATKNVKKTGAESQSRTQRPNPLRRSLDGPASAAPVQKPRIPPGPHKPTTTGSASFSSKSTTTAPKPTLERVAKNPIAGKSPTLSSSSMTRTRSLKKTASSCPTTKRGTTSSASKKPPITHDKKEAQNHETKHENKENKENLGHQIEEVVKDDELGEIRDIEIPKAEEETQQHAHVVVIDTTQVKSVEEKDTLDDISTVTLEHKVPQTEEMEDKFHEEKPDGSNSNDQHDEDKENDSKEEINVSHDDQEKVPHEETKIETEDEGVKESYTTEELAATKESGEEKNNEGREQGLESNKEETIEEEANLVAKSRVQAEAANGKKEIVEEEANMFAKSRVQAEAAHAMKEPPTPNSELVEETASKVVEEKKNKVRALVGAFETRR